MALINLIDIDNFSSEIFLGKAENRTCGCWVRTKYATSVLSCSLATKCFPSRPCSQIEEEIEDLDDGGDDSEMTCINSSEAKQVWPDCQFRHSPESYIFTHSNGVVFFLVARFFPAFRFESGLVGCEVPMLPQCCDGPKITFLKPLMKLHLGPRRNAWNYFSCKILMTSTKGWLIRS